MIYYAKKQEEFLFMNDFQVAQIRTKFRPKKRSNILDFLVQNLQRIPINRKSFKIVSHKLLLPTKSQCSCPFHFIPDESATREWKEWKKEACQLCSWRKFSAVKGSALKVIRLTNRPTFFSLRLTCNDSSRYLSQESDLKFYFLWNVLQISQYSTMKQPCLLGFSC
jgi:hypothetical protein